MPLIYSNHALIRITERGVPQYEVQDVLRSPDSIETVWDGKTKAVKKISNREITVIYYDHGKNRTICTVVVNNVS